MGLETTHNCWHGPYSSFNQFRCAIALADGFNLEEMEGYDGGRKWESLPPNKIHLLLDHSDCEGRLDWKQCGHIAESFIELYPRLDPRWQVEARQFVKGLRLARKQKKSVIFS